MRRATIACFMFKKIKQAGPATNRISEFKKIVPLNSLICQLPMEVYDGR